MNRTSPRIPRARDFMRSFAYPTRQSQANNARNVTTQLPSGGDHSNSVRRQPSQQASPQLSPQASAQRARRRFWAHNPASPNAQSDTPGCTQMRNRARAGARGRGDESRRRTQDPPLLGLKIVRRMTEQRIFHQEGLHTMSIANITECSLALRSAAKGPGQEHKRRNSRYGKSSYETPGRCSSCPESTV